MNGPLRRHAWLLPILILTALAASATPALAQKTDIVVLNNGDRITGEIKGLSLGQLTYSTHAASTIYLEWPKIQSVKSDKIFEIELEDGRKLVGSVRPAAKPDSLVLLTDGDSVEVALLSVVALDRIKDTFWKRLDGDVNVGVDYTQDNNKIDLNVSANIKYVLALQKYAFNLSTSFSRQDSASNISSLSAVFAYSRQFSGRWFYAGLLAGEQSSQLNLDIRGTVGGGLGRYLVRSNKVDFALWGGVGYSRERFTNQDADDALVGIVVTDFEYFTFGDRKTSLSTKLSVVPLLTDARVRLNFMTQYKREVVNNLYLTLSLTEAFDSKPPETANKNDLSLTTSIGWSF